MSATAADYRFMAKALQLARKGLYSAHPNPRVGCVIVAASGEVLGEGWHRRTGEPHAEAHALSMAGPRAAGATAYVTLEPCSHSGRTPPCTDALISAGIARVVYAARDANPRVAGGGARQLAEAGISVTAGVLEAEARALNIGFFSRMERGRPFVRTKLAASLDGRTALPSGEGRWITSEQSRNDVQELRARSSGILTGAGTICVDDPALSVRRSDLHQGLIPERVVLDTALRTPTHARIFSQPGRARLFCSRPDPARRSMLERAGAVIETVTEDDGRPHLGEIMRRLAELEMNEVLVEAGPGLNGALLDAGLLDEVVLYLAPHVLGADALGMFASRTLTEMARRHEFELIDLRRVGPDCRLTFRPGTL